jgi:hypothetical protein
LTILNFVFGQMCIGLLFRRFCQKKKKLLATLASDDTAEKTLQTLNISGRRLRHNFFFFSEWRCPLKINFPFLCPSQTNVGPHQLRCVQKTFFSQNFGVRLKQPSMYVCTYVHMDTVCSKQNFFSVKFRRTTEPTFYACLYGYRVFKTTYFS